MAIRRTDKRKQQPSAGRESKLQAARRKLRKALAEQKAAQAELARLISDPAAEIQKLEAELERRRNNSDSPISDTPTQ